MKKMHFKRVIALALCLMMCFSTMPMAAFASIPNWVDNNVVYDGETFGTNGYYNVISKKDYTLVPGAAVESEMVLNNAAGNRRQVLHIIEVDPSNPDVSIVPGYHQIDKDLDNPDNWSHKELTEMARYYENTLGYNIVGGMNTDLYYNSYSPRVLVYNGESIGNFGEKVASEGTVLNPTSSILYVFQDAEGNISCDVKAFNKAEFDQYLAEGKLLHAVGVSFGMTVNNGELVKKTEERTTSAAARSMVGVKEDGTLVICMNDGRGANNSVGFCDYELGESMLALGCKWAANCDGGGSSTFLTKRVGEEDFTMRSVPCDGAQRPTAHGIFVASNVAPTGVLGSVNVESKYDYFAPSTAYTFDAEAIDTHGYSMEMPADVEWTLSDASFGTIENGTFTSNGKKGTVKVQVVSNGTVVGEKSITVADPEVFKLTATSTVMPYSTATKPRTITLPIVAKIGESNVYVDTNAVNVTLSNEEAGTLDGFKFTATDNTEIYGTNVEIAFKDTVLTYEITYGRGSEVIFDFEDGDKAGFVGYAEAKKWSQENGVKNGLFDSPYPHDGQMDPFTVASTFMGTTENGGQVRNGDNALAWRFDNTDPDFAAWSYYYLYNVGETVVLRDVENGKKPTSLGMWVYVPEDAFPADGGKGFSFQSYLWVKNSEGKFSPWAQHLMFESAATGKMTNLNSATNADIPESRWVYASVDLTKYDYVCTPVATDSGTMSPAFIRSYVKPVIANEVTFYIDDITLDYSSAVDDRVLPTITNPTYSTSDTAVTLENGATINGNQIAFSATVSDNSALDKTSGKMYVDGVEINSTVIGNTLTSTEDVKLFAGKHTVAFEIKDELGNPAKLIRTFTVAGDAVITIDGHNDSGEAAKAQSVYYVDIKAADIEAVKSLKADLKLQTANTWETEGAVVASGFEANFNYNEVTQLLTVNVEVKDVEKIVADNDVLVSIPVRIWTYNRYDYLTEQYDTAVCSKNKPAVNVDCDVVYGEVALTDKTSSTFGGDINVATELKSIASPYHVHDAELTVLNKEASCITDEDGYNNRTYCESCKSVVSWGEIISGEHNYELVDNKFVCTAEGCGKVFKSGTGIFEMNGNLYYSINGELKNGWQTADDSYCYAGSDYKLYTGEQKVNGVTYKFGENGVLTEGAWVKDSKGTKYSYGPKFYTRMWVEIEGETYYFGRDSYMYTGIRFVKDNPDTPAIWYDFGESGATNKEIHPADGIYEFNNDIYIVKDGETQSGMHFVDGSYYFGGVGSGFDRFACAAKNQTVTVTSDKTNGIITAGIYQFDETGKMIINNGPVNGYLYDDNGFMVKAYCLKKVNGAYYFVSDGNKYVVNKSVYLSSSTLQGTNFPAGYYDFDATGKMVIKNGPQSDGYLYIDGVKQTAYKLVQFEGAYYFISDYNKYVADKTMYLSAKTLEGTGYAAGYFDFDATGKMVIKNGPQSDGYLYINGVKQTAYKLVQFEGAYYFISDYNKYVADKTMYLSAKTLEGTGYAAGYFDFDATGKMVIKNGPQSDGYLYIDGVKQTAYKLVQFEGAYYFISDYNKYVADKTMYLSAKTLVGTGLAAGYYTFDATGKMII